MNFLYFYFRSLLFPYYTIFSLSHFLTPKPRCFLSYPQPLLSLVVFIYIYIHNYNLLYLCNVFRVDPLVLHRQLLCSSLGKAVSLALSILSCL